MQLRERQYQSRLANRIREGKSETRFSVTNRAQRPPLQVMKTVMKWAPLVVVLAIVWYLLDEYVF